MEKKTKLKRIEVLVTLTSKGVKTFQKKNSTDNWPPNVDGERRDLVYLGATTIDQLVALATNELKKYYYNGLHGKFTTFGIPYVRQGDNVQLVDKVLPERNGTYKCKSVEYSGGVGGLRQIIELDYKIS